MPAKSRSYYGRPIVKGHIWEDYIALYLFVGGLSGASAALGAVARARKRNFLARSCTISAAGGAAISAALLIADLGNPERFLHMLRVVKITSPMNVGTWILSAFGITTGIAAALEMFGSHGKIQTVAGLGSAILGLPLSTYTAVLIADTATPAWHEARAELPLVFAASAALSAGAWNSLFLSRHDAAVCRRLMVGAGVCELIAHRRMVQRLGALLGEPYSIGKAGRYAKTARGLTVTAVLTTALFGKRSRVAAAGAALAALGGALCERFSVFHAGTQSAADPKYVVDHQRAAGQRNS